MEVLRKEVLIRKLINIITYQDLTYARKKATELSRVAQEQQFLKDAENIGMIS